MQRPESFHRLRNILSGALPSAWEQWRWSGALLLSYVFSESAAVITVILPVSLHCFRFYIRKQDSVWLCWHQWLFRGRTPEHNVWSMWHYWQRYGFLFKQYNRCRLAHLTHYRSKVWGLLKEITFILILLFHLNTYLVRMQYTVCSKLIKSDSKYIAHTHTHNIYCKYIHSL